MNMKYAWEQVQANKKGFLKAAFVPLVISIAVSFVCGLGDGLFEETFFEPIWGILTAIVQVIFSYMAIISGLHLMDLLVVQGRAIPLGEAVKEYFYYFQENWRKPLKTWLLWGILMPIVVGLAVSLSGFLIVCAISGVSAFGLMQDLGMNAMSAYYLLDHAAYLISFLGPVVLILLLFMVGLGFVMMLITSTLGFYMQFKVYAKMTDRDNVPVSFTKAFMLSLIPAISTTLVILVTMSVIMVMAASYEVAFIIMIPAALILLLIALFGWIYGYFASLCVIDDINQEAAEKPLPDIPAGQPVSESENMNL